uniref:Mitochondrial calcium uniporter n=1 Tax=Equus caballus TaxID=9796 RepID=A0A9L0SJI0_HORSE
MAAAAGRSLLLLLSSRGGGGGAGGCGALTAGCFPGLGVSRHRQQQQHRTEYVYPEARDRQYLLFFHKGAKKSRFDLEKYNQLKDAIAQAKMDLKRLRDPLQVHLPLRQIGEKD